MEKIKYNLIFFLPAMLKFIVITIIKYCEKSIGETKSMLLFYTVLLVGKTIQENFFYKFQLKKKKY